MSSSVPAELESPHLAFMPFIKSAESLTDAWRSGLRSLELTCCG